MEAAKSWAKLEAPADPKNPKSGTLRQSLEALAKAGMPRDPLLDPKPVPDGFAYLWNLFCEIRNGASEGFSGARITWRDIADYHAVTGLRLDAFEVEAVMAMDGALREASALDDATS